VLWDVGANVGIYTLYAAQREVTVCAFEPLAANYYVLNRNIQLNGLSGRICAYCLAFSGEARLGVLNTPVAVMGAALSHFGDAGRSLPVL